VGEVEGETTAADGWSLRLSVNPFGDGYVMGIHSKRTSDKNSQACSSNSEVIANLTNSAAAGVCLLAWAEKGSVTIGRARSGGQINPPELYFVVFQMWKSVNHTPLTQHSMFFSVRKKNA
jgi:hypothetical protein